MAVKDIQILYENLPKVFDLRSPPLGDLDDFVIFPEEELLDLLDDSIEMLNDSPNGNLIFDPNVLPISQVQTVDIPKGSEFPGGPVWIWKTPYPPPDALAFYLPFHYFYPDWWGIYLTLEGVWYLASLVERLTGGVVSFKDAFQAAKTYLYGHEFFHHAVESFATRLEVTHRKPIYKKGFELLFQETVGTDECLEEALGCAYGWRLVKMNSSLKQDEKKYLAVLNALARYIEGCPPGYRRGMKLVSTTSYRNNRSSFAEKCHQRSIKKTEKDPNLWSVFPHSFNGLGNVKSRTNYIVRRDSPLLNRIRLRVRYYSPRDLKDALRKLGFNKEKGRGKGSHEVWKNSDGRTTVVPQHKELKVGTIKSIIRQIGLNISLTEFFEL